MQQRGIRVDTLETLLDFGRTAHVDRGREIVFFDKAAPASGKAEAGGNQGWERLRRTYAILGSDGAVITVGHRYRRIPRG
jgi:hypothetical protein